MDTRIKTLTDGKLLEQLGRWCGLYQVFRGRTVPASGERGLRPERVLTQARGERSAAERGA